MNPDITNYRSCCARGGRAVERCSQSKGLRRTDLAVARDPALQRGCDVVGDGVCRHDAKRRQRRKLRVLLIQEPEVLLQRATEAERIKDEAVAGVLGVVRRKLAPRYGVKVKLPFLPPACARCARVMLLHHPLFVCFDVSNLFL